MLLGLAAVAARRATAGGVLLGAAIAVKMFPAAALVGASKRKPWHTWGAAVLTVAGAYVPYLLASGSAVVGYLPGYLREERYDDGARFGLLDLALPEAVAPSPRSPSWPHRGPGRPALRPRPRPGAPR
ncbi:hypothetical protein ACU686_42470 [Yinghuangia aomiensis]